MTSYSKYFFFFIAFTAGVSIHACSDNSSPFQIDFEEVAPPPYERSAAVRDSLLGEGLEIFILQEGDDHFEVTPNDQIQVRYTGRTNDGEIFDTSYRGNLTDNTTIFSNLTPGGQSSLVEGFRKGIVGMKEGEKRIIEIPPAMGYSNAQSGTNGFNLRGETLIFDVELVAIL